MAVGEKDRQVLNKYTLSKGEMKCTLTNLFHRLVHGQTVHCEPQTLLERLDGSSSESETKVGHGIPRSIGFCRCVHESAAITDRRISGWPVCGVFGAGVDSLQQCLVCCGGSGGRANENGYIELVGKGKRMFLYQSV